MSVFWACLLGVGIAILCGALAVRESFLQVYTSTLFSALVRLFLTTRILFIALVTQQSVFTNNVPRRDPKPSGLGPTVVQVHVTLFKT